LAIRDAPWLILRAFCIMSQSTISNRPASARSWLGLGSLLVGLCAWWLVSSTAHLPAFILPSPIAVWLRFLSALSDGTLVTNTSVTLLEVLLGLFFGVGLATILGYLVAKSRSLERVLSPYLVASQAVPLVAIAPLLVIWFGPGMFSKVLICALIVFFPVLVNTVVGVRAVPSPLHDLMRSLHATRSQILLKLRNPRCIAHFPRWFAHRRDSLRDRSSGGRVGWIGSRPGLSHQYRSRAVRYCARLRRCICVNCTGLVLYGIVAWMESRALIWQEWRTSIE